MDDADEEAWLEARRAEVQDYLRRQGVDHFGVAEFPAFHVHPHVALWAVQSAGSRGRIGWWVISGDLPTDYLSGGDASHPRAALRMFAHRWRELSAYMLRGEPHPDVAIGTPEQWPALGELLRQRAEILQRLADDDDEWSDA